MKQQGAKAAHHITELGVMRVLYRRDLHTQCKHG
jgi:hypothetical protein